MWGLKVLLPVFIIIQQGLGHTPCRVARPGIGLYAHGRGELGCGVQAWGEGFPHTVVPQWWCVGWGAAGVSGPPHSAWHPRTMPGAALGSPSPSPVSIIVPTLCGTSSLLFAPQQWQSVSEESQCSLAFLCTSPGFNLPGQPVVGLSNLTPSVPSLTGSHQVSSTWPARVLTSGLSSPHLTINQANSVYILAAQCQAVGIKLAKKFQVLPSLEAIHRNSIQGTVHEMLTLGCSAWEATYFAFIRDKVPDHKCEATTHHLHSEADVAWKEMHEVM